MEKLTVKKNINIQASQEKVWHVLLTPSQFKEWGEAFCPDSEMKGEWKAGGLVTYTDNTGMGLKAKVIEFKPSQRVTVEYVSVLNNFKETNQEPGWIGCKETYILSKENGGTNLKVESEVPTKKYYEEFKKNWGLALIKIKELAEIQ